MLILLLGVFLVMQRSIILDNYLQEVEKQQLMKHTDKEYCLVERSSSLKKRLVEWMRKKYLKRTEMKTDRRRKKKKKMGKVKLGKWKTLIMTIKMTVW